MLLLTTQTTGICFWCVFILMLGSFLIGYFAKDLKLPAKKITETKENSKDQQEKKDEEERVRLKPLGVIKTI